MSETIDICICSFRRPSLEQALESVAGQMLPAGIALRVIVADNDETAANRAQVAAWGRRLGLDLVYVHAPARNISIARNACLDTATADWIIFIDDDEVATPDWVARLLAARQDHQVVFGVSQALFPDPATPRWIREGDFHSNRIGGNDAPWNGYTANVLIDRRFAAARGLRFDLALGQIGGEDTMFFFEMDRAGARFGYAPDAVVLEDTTPARATLGWLARRRYRAGQVHHMLLQRASARPITAGALAGVKAAACFGQAALSLPRRGRMAHHLLRGMLHIGVVASTLGFAPYREYGAPRK